MKTYYVDGGCKGKMTSAGWKAFDGYFSVVGENGVLIHYEKNIENIYSANECEYLAIKWVIENIIERPIIISSDSMNAINWSYRSTKRSRELKRLPLSLKWVEIVHESFNLADRWNANNVNYKYIP